MQCNVIQLDLLTMLKNAAGRMLDNATQHAAILVNALQGENYQQYNATCAEILHYALHFNSRECIAMWAVNAIPCKYYEVLKFREDLIALQYGALHSSILQYIAFIGFDCNLSHRRI